ncbi:MAG TPA: carboxypeptidase-like regulatory domain-containing protein [Blastocatellia bacterium]|nr:carboxypeptidase-like regulatory domain-containing protein [Blastocatellia bacterium]
MRRLHLAILVSALLVSLGSARAQTSKAPATEPRAGQQTTAAQDKAPRGPKSLRGRVLGDGGRPVADASIMTIPVNITSNPQGAMTSLLRPVNTDADGKFEITGLQPGAYTVTASSPGYVLSDSDAKQFYRPGDNATLTLAKGAVITGRVTSQTGDPMVGVVVRAIKIRELDDKRPRPRTGPLSEITDAFSSMLGPFRTDDRGIYRIYGLASGAYQVAAGGHGDGAFPFTGSGVYDTEAPTYYPSSTIDTASEVVVHTGDEAQGIDIRYRDNRGRSISGTVTGSVGSGQPTISVILTRASTGIVEGTAFVLPTTKERGFAFSGLLDGEYVTTAVSNVNSMLEAGEGLNASASQPRRVTLSGFDVTGVELALEPLGTIAGWVALESVPASARKDACKLTAQTQREEIVIDSRTEAKPKLEDLALGPLAMFNRTAPNEKGEFKVGLLRPGVYHLEAHLPNDDLFIKSMTLPPSTPNAKPVDAAKTGVRLKAGDKATGLIMTISEGAAGMKGRVVAGEQNKAPSEKIRLYLVPAEPDAVDHVLRYFEAEAGIDGSFSLTNLPPGQYWLVARDVSDEEEQSDERRPLAWNVGGRTGLRFEGEATRKVIELGQCQRVTDFVVKYIPLIKPSKPAAKKPAQYR